jgi:hypothetical protein
MISIGRRCTSVSIQVGDNSPLYINDPGSFQNSDCKPIEISPLLSILSFVVLLIFIVLIGYCCYCCCCRKNRTKPTMVQLQEKGNDYC